MDMKGPYLIDLERHVDDRGDLVELWRHSWSIFGNSQFAQQVYTVRSRYPGIIRALHRHEFLAELFTVVTGAAKFVLVDEETGEGQVVILDDRVPRALYVPAGIYHGWMALEPDTRMLAVMNGEYDKENPDEERVDPHTFSRLFDGDPWEVRGR